MGKPKKVLFSFIWLGISLCVILLVGELISTSYLLWRDKKLVPVAKLIDDSEGFYRAHSGTEACTWADRLQQHPYFGYVYQRAGPCNTTHVNQFGFRGVKIPQKKDPAEHVVMLVGGSVAELYGSGDYLEKALNAEFTSDKIKHFRVITGAMGGWKQPQQAIFFLLMGGGADTLINLDGYNERYALAGGMTMENPALNLGARYYRGVFAHFVMSSRYFLNELVYRLQAFSPIVRKSRFLFLASKGLRDWSRTLADSGEYFESQPVLEDGLLPFSYPRDPSPETTAKLAAGSLERYLLYLRSMHAFAEVYGVKDFYFLQPVPLLGKVLTAEEREIIVTPAIGNYAPIYEKLEKSFLGLGKKGLKVNSLTAIFSREKERVYEDEIHLNPKGFAILNDAIVSKLRPYFKSLGKPKN